MSAPFSARSVAARRLGVLATLACGIALLACRSRTEQEADIANGDDAFAALAVSVPSARYNTRYWVTQAERDPTSWGRAQTYCAEQRAAAQGAKPNCAPVFEAQSDLSVRNLRPRRPPAGQQVDSLMFRP